MEVARGRRRFTIYATLQYLQGCLPRYRCVTRRKHGSNQNPERGQKKLSLMNFKRLLDDIVENKQEKEIYNDEAWLFFSHWCGCCNMLLSISMILLRKNYNLKFLLEAGAEVFKDTFFVSI